MAGASGRAVMMRVSPEWSVVLSSSEAMVSGISSGIMAAALAYGSADRERQLEFFAFAFREVRQRFAPTRVASTLLPPYDVSGGATLDQVAASSAGVPSFAEATFLVDRFRLYLSTLS